MSALRSPDAEPHSRRGLLVKHELVADPGSAIRVEEFVGGPRNTLIVATENQELFLEFGLLRLRQPIERSVGDHVFTKVFVLREDEECLHVQIFVEADVAVGHPVQATGSIDLVVVIAGRLREA